MLCFCVPHQAQHQHACSPGQCARCIASTACHPPAALLSCRALLLSEDGSSSRIPGFWLYVLRSTEPGALAITRRDAAVLSQLADVRCSMMLPKAVDSRGLTEVTVACEWVVVAGKGVYCGCGLTGSYTNVLIPGVYRCMQDLPAVGTA